MKKKIDIASPSLPRLMTFRNVSGLLSCIEDRDDFHIRWLFHLDQYPGLEEDWEASLIDACKAVPLFDDALLFASKTNVGYGGVIHRLMSEVEQDVLWVEDDWEWNGYFKLGDIQKAIADEGAYGFNFSFRREKIGAMRPAYWTHPMVQYLLSRWPASSLGMTEKKIKRRIMRGGKFINARGASLMIPKSICREVGGAYMLAHGITCNHAGTVLCKTKLN